MAAKGDIVNPFVDVPILPTIADLPAQPITWALGYGDVSLKIDRQGLWLGGNKFGDAPFRVTMDGQITAAGLLTTSTTLDQIADGTSYKRVLATSISAGKIILSQSIGNLGDVADGGGYSKVLTTVITAGRIILAQTVGTIDDIADGGSYQKTTFAQVVGATRGLNGLDSSFSIVKGFVNAQLNSVGLPANGVRIDVNGIYGTRGGNLTFYINTAGDAYFSGTIAATNIYSSYLEGSFFQSAPSGQNRVTISNSNDGKERIEFYQGNTIVGKIRSQPGLFQFWAQGGQNAEINGETIFMRSPNGGGTTVNVEQLSSQSGGGVYFNDAGPRPLADNDLMLGSPNLRWKSLMLTPQGGDPPAYEGRLYVFRSGTTYRLKVFLNGGWRSVTLT